MSVLAVARADLRRLLRSRRLWAAAVLLGLMFLPSTPNTLTPDRRPIAETLLLIPFEMLALVLVLVGAVGYGAVAGERRDGTVRLLLSLPTTRRGVVLGKYLARAIGAVVVLAAVLAVANVVVARNYGSPYLAAYWTMGAWLLLYAAVWTAVAVGYSAVFATPFRAVGALAATYAVFGDRPGLWSVAVRPLAALAATGSTAVPAYESLAAAPVWLRAVERLNPLTDFWEAMSWSVRAVGPGDPVGGPLPHVLGTGLFLLFGAVPLAVGLRRFERADLGGEPDPLPLVGRLRRAARAGTDALVGRIAGLVRATKSSSGVGADVSEADEGTDGRAGDGRRWRTLLAADLRHALADRIVAVGVLLAALIAVPGLLTGVRADTAEIFGISGVLTRIPGQFRLSTLVLAAVVGGRAVVAERSAGTLRFVLGTGGTRRGFARAKAASRAAVVAATLLAGLLFAEFLVFVRLGDPYPLAFLTSVVSTLWFGALWTAVALGASAATSSVYRALAAYAGFFLVFGRQFGLWGTVVQPLFGSLSGGRFDPYAVGGDDALAFRYLDRLNPFVALDTVEEWLYAVVGHGPEAAAVGGPGLPLVAFSVIVAALFVVAPLVVGLWRFERADLG